MITEKKEHELINLSHKIRLMGMDMAKHAGKNGAHYGGSFSCVEILAALYGYAAKYDVNNTKWEDRDRILISKRHCVLSLYPVMAEMGFFNKEVLNSFVDDDGILASYPVNIDLGLEYSAGTLGMALSVGIGKAIAAKRDKKEYRIFVLIGDGECNEGSIWESFMSAAQFGLNNLTVIMDNNHLCYDGVTDEIMSIGNIYEIMRNFGWKVIRCDGHSIRELCRAYDDIDSDRPHIIIADTLKGKGVSFMEQHAEWHQRAMSDEQLEQAMKELTERASYE